MFRNKNKKNSARGGSTFGGQYGTFHAAKSRLSKTMRLFITALLAVIFVSGLALALFRNSNKPKIQQAAEAAIDRIPGWWYQQYFRSSVCSADNCQPDADPDQDKLTNAQEYYYHTDPLNPRTVGDELTDGQLVAQNFDPSRPGKISFEQVLTDDSIMAEGLVFNSDVTKLINESVDLSNVQLPVINETELNISDDNTRDGIKKYTQSSQAIMDKYFSKDAQSYIGTVAHSPSPEGVADIRVRTVRAADELMKLAVPSEFVTIHKYSLMLLKLLPDVINVPDQASLLSEYDPAGNAWFDKTQALMSVYQKIELESRRLQEKFK